MYGDYTGRFEHGLVPGHTSSVTCRPKANTLVYSFFKDPFDINNAQHFEQTTGLTPKNDRKVLSAFCEDATILPLLEIIEYPISKKVVAVKADAIFASPSNGLL